MEVSDDQMREASNEFASCINNSQYLADDAEYFISDLTADVKAALLSAIRNQGDYLIVLTVARET